MILGQYGPVVIGTWWHWFSKMQYWLVLGCAKSVEVGTSLCMVALDL